MEILEWCQCPSVSCKRFLMLRYFRKSHASNCTCQWSGTNEKSFGQKLSLHFWASLVVRIFGQKHQVQIEMLNERQIELSSRLWHDVRIVLYKNDIKYYKKMCKDDKSLESTPIQLWKFWNRLGKLGWTGMKDRKKHIWISWNVTFKP